MSKLLSWLSGKGKDNASSISRFASQSVTRRNQAETNTETPVHQAKEKTELMVLVDNGHGKDTKGKRSPDGTLLEWKYTREIATKIVESLREEGYNAALLTPSDADVPLNERVAKANKVCKAYGAKNVCVVSIHLNAAGNGTTWKAARGWQVCVGLNASVRSMKLAEDLYNAAKDAGLKTRRPSPTQNFWQQNLAICRDTNCPAVLTENLFMDNLDDWRYLQTDEGRDAIVRTHVEGIKKYIDSL